jgi:UDP-glucuronate decarboxylase
MEKGKYYDKKTVLVIGGAGFIGSHLCDELIKNCRVVCLDNYSSGDEKNIDHLLSEENFKFIRHDISEPVDFSKYPELTPFKIEFQGIQEIYNCACPTSPKYFDQNKIATLLANSYGVKNGLDLAVKYGAKYLHYSSSVIYGPRREGNPKIKETDLGQVDLLSPRSSYDEGKRFAETIVINYRETLKVDAKIIRLFRIYGPRMKLNDGQMIPDFIVAALDNRDLLIQGDKTFSSSFCFVSDVVDASLKLMEHDQAGPFNIGSDQDVNLTDLAEKIIKMTGSKSKVAFQEKLLFFSELSLPNIDLARNELNWLPIVTLEHGLEKTIYDLRASKGIVDFKATM